MCAMISFSNNSQSQLWIFLLLTIYCCKISCTQPHPNSNHLSDSNGSTNSSLGEIISHGDKPSHDHDLIDYDFDTDDYDEDDFDPNPAMVRSDASHPICFAFFWMSLFFLYTFF
uniref:Transmembrane protein n=1 Tax=Daphnia galeata TaxID=27404 RepID=A0A8J2RT69_9CRUS|nr:unnamed protein product [Daphnia galeata]